ncbi:Ribbon-helix-helix protein, CopG [uncultured Caudovirales phage]|uniref:Ribbon-helix-helix protein, CopG n=1 Tax=uncultured Caudovirales phage TaxID=2100421 RepID=A0A6J5SIJ3_9CAUD|nr:Ribbon-helix-helix protein, CopG [uncultured Caudovirales phage]
MSNNKENILLSVRIPKELKEKLYNRAEAEYRTTSALVRYILEAALGK